ncbi:rogdi leucine zipper containing protein [Sarocladium implicatum]|nr:rogdi leucine zipper containing protein [Sarocladium implicatum]
MSLSVWPPIPPHELLQKADESLQNDLQWIIQNTLDTCQELKHGLEDCYALLAPIDPGSTLVMSTSRSERVKGTITRVGTRIAKGSLNLQLKTIPVQTISLAPNQDVHIKPLERLHKNLNQAIDLLGITLSSNVTAAAATSLASTLSLLSDSFSESITLLKGSPSQTDAWQTSSCPPSLFTPDPGPNLSFFLTIEDCAMVLYLRALEPVDAPVHLGLKLGLALGTFRRLEHDEMDLVFKYDPSGQAQVGERRHGHDAHTKQTQSGAKAMEDVYVREKVRVDTGDPNLISLHSKLLYLSRTLGQAQSNLAAVMGTDTIE